MAGFQPPPGQKVRSFQQPAKPAGRVDAQGRPRRADGGFADPRDQQAYFERAYPEYRGGRPATPWSTSKKWNNAPGLWKDFSGPGAWGHPPQSQPPWRGQPAPQPDSQQPQEQHIRAPRSGQPQAAPAAPWQPPQDDASIIRLAAQFGVPVRPHFAGQMTAQDRKLYQDAIAQRVAAEEARFGVKYNSAGVPTKVPQEQQPSPQPTDQGSQPSSPWGQPGQSPWAQPPSRDFNYQPAFNAAGQAVNSGHITGRLAAESKYAPSAGSEAGNRGVSDLQKSLLMENTAQGMRGIEATNAEQNMKDQAARSEAMQQALGNQTRMYSDATNRATDQMSLASQIQQAMMESRNRFRTAMMS